MSRHIKSKHPSVHDSATNVPMVPNKVNLHPLKLKSLIEEVSRTLSMDQCYPDNILKEIGDFSFDYNKIISITDHIVKIIDSNPNHEVAMPKLYKLFATLDVFPGLSPMASRLLGSEISMSVLAYLENPDILSKGLTVPLFTEFSERELHSLVYVAGSVFGTLYRRFRFSARQKSDLVKFLPVLLAGKSDKSLGIHKLVDAKDRGGLWRVTIPVVELFKRAEQYFVVYSSHWSKRFDTDAVVQVLMEDSQILSSFRLLLEESSLKVVEEDSLNLLDKILTLFLRIRYFSYAKSKIDTYKAKQRKGKGKALRKQLKSSDISICE